MKKELEYVFQRLNTEKYIFGGVRMSLKKLSILLLTLIIAGSFMGCSTSQPEQTNNDKQDLTRTITDMAGRTVTIPTELNKIYATGSIGTLFVYTLAPEKIAGWNSQLGSDKQYIKPEYYDLPVLGRWKGTNSTNIEEILKVKPDIIINMGDINEQYIIESDEIAELLNIPVIMVDGTLTKQAESYEFLGNILEKEDRAKDLADYSREVIKDIKEKSQLIQDNEKVEVYYGAGLTGLETMPRASINTEVLDLVAGVNVADSGTNKDLRRMEISLEQLISWNPELIVLSSNSSNNPELYNNILNDASWANIDAVKNKKVYEIPYGPYDWFNQPPTLLRIMGMQWLGDLLYPEVYQIDIEQETKQFFDLFFDYQITDENIDQLLGKSIRK